MAKQKQDKHQLALDFGQASITPVSPAVAAIVHAHLPPPNLPPLILDNPTSDVTNHAEIPVPTPLSESVAKGVFGIDEYEEPIEPSAEEVQEISLLHGGRLAELFVSLEEVNESLGSETSDGRGELIREKERITCQIQGILALYAEDFGDVAARRLESWARERAESERNESPTIEATRESGPKPDNAPQYDAGHPWHYLQRGDGAKPLALDEIVPSPCDGEFVGKLPRDCVKRHAKLMKFLEDETVHLAEFETNYQDLVKRGSNALSEHDRKIAYGGDGELAVASSLALRVNHIAHSRGRVQWLKTKLGLLTDYQVSPGGSHDIPKPPSPITLVRQPNTAEAPSFSKGSRAEKLEKLHDTVEKALDQLAASLEAGKSETLVAWLKTMSRFHNYSLNNQMLIAWQRPDATHVAGFHAWKKFNRLVSKGEKGIMILAPVTRMVGVAEETAPGGETRERKLRQIVNTKPVYVFDISQTHGDPLPELARMQGDPAEHRERIKELIQREGIELQYADRLPNGAQGNSQGGRIGVVNGLSWAEEFRTLVHEFAHELLHRGQRRKETTRRSRELEAESVAFVVCNTIGLDARQTSTDYIHLFRGDKAMLFESLQFIREVSQRILNGLLNDAPHFEQEAA